ncbi:glutamine--fructose-6-phosphate transaminase (isomerizing) [Roseiterribacter gracilis]|uniref:Glutamine--fructose-6-phosphate aminotransferase [isomerizing] n=1 Tax=Roseiterribacter gracilis TaxID=2812848 RepID=A0A8S8XEH1_9PROT|nr:glutamine--fructose-6-phosphate aminotransferase [isomerizing] [Rhodospirillales bacterium TMPK1]
MCGIIGVVGNSQAVPHLMDALRRLEYRGYDSAGVATLVDGRIDRRRAQGKLINLDKRLQEEPLSGSTGIGHTRWATHGAPVERNAHPHATDRVAIVHNGIIENYQTLKAELEKKQHRFDSQTDTEVVVRLVDDLLQQGMKPREAASAALKRLEGAFALVMLFQGEDDLLVAARHGPPLAVGYGDGEMYVASDAIALANLTNKISYLHDGDWVEVTKSGAIVHHGPHDEEIVRPVYQTSVSGAVTGKGEFRHYMLKEIYEQPAVVGDTLNALVHPSTGAIALPDLPFDLATVSKVTIVACGTAYYAGLTAKYWIEQVARVPVECDVASEFRYRQAPMQDGGVTVLVSQSGETADTLEALRYAKRCGQKILSVINVQESTIARESDAVLYTKAGPEIGVASTKAFTTQLAVLACFSLALARARGAITAEREAELALSLREAPSRMVEILKHDETIARTAPQIAEARDVLYLGRGLAYPLALEGALKLKEISYIHAEGYAAGEMKHGPIALIDESVPIIVLAPSDSLFDKTASNVQEVAARGGRVYAISDSAGLARLDDAAEWKVEMPAIDPFVVPLLYALPVQLLAYHVAVFKGTDVDQPRNLAKSVTVE